jgi:hypothetical protein
VFSYTLFCCSSTHFVKSPTDKYPEEKLKGKRLSSIEGKNITDQVTELFGLDYKQDLHLIFFPIRAHVIEHGGEAKSLGIRARTLVNLTESLLLPVPLFICLFGLHLLFAWAKQWTCSTFSLTFLFSFIQIIIGLPLYLLIILFATCGIHWLLVERYFQLEQYWVRHYYRAFLVMQNDSFEASKK